MSEGFHFYYTWNYIWITLFHQIIVVSGAQNVKQPTFRSNICPYNAILSLLRGWNTLWRWYFLCDKLYDVHFIHDETNNLLTQAEIIFMWMWYKHFYNKMPVLLRIPINTLGILKLALFAAFLCVALVLNCRKNPKLRMFKYFRVFGCLRI